MDFIVLLIGLFVGFIGGGVAILLFLRKNPHYLAKLDASAMSAQIKSATEAAAVKPPSKLP